MIGAVDWYGIAAVIAAVFSGVAAVLTVLISRPVRATHRQVKMSNGATLGATIEAVSDKVGVRTHVVLGKAPPPAGPEDHAPTR